MEALLCPAPSDIYLGMFLISMEYTDLSELVQYHCCSLLSCLVCPLDELLRVDRSIRSVKCCVLIQLLRVDWYERHVKCCVLIWSSSELLCVGLLFFVLCVLRLTLCSLFGSLTYSLIRVHGGLALPCSLSDIVLCLPRQVSEWSAACWYDRLVNCCVLIVDVSVRSSALCWYERLVNCCVGFSVVGLVCVRSLPCLALPCLALSCLPLLRVDWYERLVTCWVLIWSSGELLCVEIVVICSLCLETHLMFTGWLSYVQFNSGTRRPCCALLHRIFSWVFLGRWVKCCVLIWSSGELLCVDVSVRSSGACWYERLVNCCVVIRASGELLRVEYLY
jgi:hypothetical protein